MSSAVTVLGIDAGSKACGWAVLLGHGTKATYVASGVALAHPDDDLSARQDHIYRALRVCVLRHSPQVAFMEDVVKRGVSVPLAEMMGMLRGLAIEAGCDRMFRVAAKTWRKMLFGGGRYTAKQRKVMAIDFVAAQFGFRPEAHDEAEAICIAAAGIRSMA